MSEVTEKDILREINEFLKFLRRIIILLIAMFVIMLMPISFSSREEPLSLYLLKLSINSPFINVPENITLIMGEPGGPIRVILASSLFFAMIFGSPIALFLFYRYLKPALYPHERRIAVSMTLATAGLFYAGIIYGFLVIAPITIRIMFIFGSVAGAEPMITIASFYEFIVISVIATAVGFLIPIGVYLINRVLGIDLNLRKYWRYILVVTYAIVAVITPDPTPITALLIIGPPLTLSVVAELVAMKKK